MLYFLLAQSRQPWQSPPRPDYSVDPVDTSNLASDIAWFGWVMTFRLFVFIVICYMTCRLLWWAFETFLAFKIVERVHRPKLEKKPKRRTRPAQVDESITLEDID